MIEVNNCTLFCVDCVQPELAAHALEKSCEKIKFKVVKFFSNVRPKNLHKDFEFIEIQNINNLEEYSRFIIYILPSYIDTDFCFSVHHDGFIINPELWNDAFLQYDYIGAPWKRTACFLYNGERVGNGGVSIRSKRLVDFTQKIYMNNIGHEDTFICASLRQHLTNSGFTFAPLNVAANFSVEQYCDDLDHKIENTFAFHGCETEAQLNEYNKLKQSLQHQLQSL